jgi:hypothetical protein
VIPPSTAFSLNPNLNSECPCYWLDPKVDFVMGHLASKDRNAGDESTVRQVGGPHLFDCVVGVPRQQCPLEGEPMVSSKVALGAGCFWGVDHYITKRK